MEMQERSGIDLMSDSKGGAGGTGTTVLDEDVHDMGEGILSNRRPALAEKRVCEEIREQDSSADESSPVKPPVKKERQPKKVDIEKLREKIE